MEKHCTMVYFSLRESKKDKQGKSPIEVSISVDAERVYINTGKKDLSSEWNKEKQMVRGKSKEVTLLNEYLTQHL